MAESLSKPDVSQQRIPCALPKPTMAKALLNDRTLREKRAEYGHILRRTREIAGMNRDECARALGQLDPAQVSRFEAGTEPQPTWRYRSHPKLRLAYMEAQAEDLERQTKDAPKKVTQKLVIEIEKGE
jgi:hypothetical protein